jgi:hypothetical protein
MTAAARLYGSAFCHLCEAAQEILKTAGIAVTVVDILGNDLLLDRYGTRIPVLQRADNGAELDWPFDATQAARFLN